MHKDWSAAPQIKSGIIWGWDRFADGEVKVSGGASAIQVAGKGATLIVFSASSAGPWRDASMRPCNTLPRPCSFSPEG